MNDLLSGTNLETKQNKTKTPANRTTRKEQIVQARESENVIGLVWLRCFCWLHDSGICKKRLNSPWTMRLSRRPGRSLYEKGSAVLGHWAAAPMKQIMSSFREPQDRLSSEQEWHYPMAEDWMASRQSQHRAGKTRAPAKAQVQVQDVPGRERSRLVGTLYTSNRARPFLGKRCSSSSLPTFP